MNEDFKPVEKPIEFDVTFEIEGEVRIRIQAETEAEALAEAQTIADDLDDEFGLELDDVMRVSRPMARKAPIMYRVWQDGQKMQVSRISDGDTPREADERGF